jgi:hypothetical protein
VLLVSGWTVAAVLQPGSFNPAASTISALAADGAADRWVMTLAFLIAGAREIVFVADTDPGRLAQLRDSEEAHGKSGPRRLRCVMDTTAGE